MNLFFILLINFKKCPLLFTGRREMRILRKLNHFSNLHEMTKIIIKDMDIHFFSQFRKSLCHKLHNKLEFNCSNHVQNLGQLHVNRDLVEFPMDENICKNSKKTSKNYTISLRINKTKIT